MIIFERRKCVDSFSKVGNSQIRFDSLSLIENITCF